MPMLMFYRVGIYQQTGRGQERRGWSSTLVVVLSGVALGA